MLLILGLGGSVFFFQPRWLLSLFTTVNPGAVFFAKVDPADTEAPMIALTLDDGPYPGTTEEILDVLAEHDAKATFFVIGDRIPSHSAALQRMARDGHELGNHLMADEASAKLSASQFEAALLETEQRIVETVGKSAFFPTAAKLGWMRPGMGWYNAGMIAIAQKHHYRTALGDIFPYDTHLNSVQFAQQQILWNAKPGSIIVLHDGTTERGERTASTLRFVLPELQRRGYRVVTLSELFGAE